jgi:cbb3-type cytochrome oxidase subunit 1
VAAPRLRAAGAIIFLKGLPLHPVLWSWLPAPIEFLLFGWVVQITMGMAFWILPRIWQNPRHPKEGYAQIAFVLLNLGIWLVAVRTAFCAEQWFLPAGRAAEGA